MESKSNYNNFLLRNERSEGCIVKFFSNCFNLNLYSDIKKPLYILNRLIAIYMLFYIIELIGGISNNSYIIISESTFLLIEIFNLSFNSIKSYFNKIETNYTFTFGYNRVESIFIILNIFIIWIISIIQIVISIIKIINSSKNIIPKGTFIFSIICSIINISLLIVIYDILTYIRNFCLQMRSDNPYTKYDDEIKDSNLLNDTSNEVITNNKVNIELDNVYNDNNSINESKLDASENGSVENETNNNLKNINLLTLNKTEIKGNIKRVEKKINEFYKENIIINKNNVNSVFFPYQIKLFKSFFVFGFSLLLFFDKNMKFSIIDPLYTIFISFFLLFLTIQIIKQHLFILLESSDNCPSPDDIEKYISINQPNISKLHDIHIWSLNDNTHCVSFHVIIDDENLRNNINYNISINKDILINMTNDLREKFGFKYVNIQIESSAQYLNICKSKN